MSITGKKYLVLVIFILLGFFICNAKVFAAVRVNEIAWMGTTNSANDEWMELYNTDTSVVNLSGWTLVANDGAPLITLAGSISGSGYFLLERTDDSTVPTVSADQIYSGALGNEGENLSLKDTSGTTVDSVNQTGGWIGGDNVTKETMQYTGTIWITGSGTPKAENVSDDSNNGDDDDDNEDTDDDNETTTQTSNSVKDEEKKKVDIYTLELATDSVIIAGNPTRFRVGVYKNDIRQILGIHAWNFGDGTFVEDTEKHLRNDFDVTHIYKNPGTYVAVFEYRTSIFKKDPEVRHRVTIDVVPHTVDIASVIPGESITLKNATSKEVALDAWIIMTSGGTYTFPRNTIILPNTELIFSQETLGIPIDMTARLLLSDQKTVVSSVEKNISQRVVTSSQKIASSPYFESSSNNDDIVATPIRESVLGATVLYADQDRVQNNKNRSETAIPFILLGVILIVGFLGVGGVLVYFFTKKNNTQTLSADDITILEDD